MELGEVAMHENAAAAVTLAIAVIVATVGTIYQVDAVSTPCSGSTCAAEAASGMASPPDGWEASFQQALRQTQRGFLEMAGLAPAPQVPHESPVVVAYPTHPSHPNATTGGGLSVSVSCDGERDC
jgi:hypothetical protein